MAKQTTKEASAEFKAVSRRTKGLTLTGIVVFVVCGVFGVTMLVKGVAEWYMYAGLLLLVFFGGCFSDMATVVKFTKILPAFIRDTRNAIMGKTQ